MSEWITASFSALLALLSIPTVGLPAVFAWCVASATLLPLGSEAVVFGYIKFNPEMFFWGILLATAGNTLGGMINYWLAYGAKTAVIKNTKPHTQTPRALVWFEKLGPKALFFSFIPVIGDPLTAVAGWLKMPWFAVLMWQMAGKLTRYLLATSLLLFVPDAWWVALLEPFKSLF